ncbi:Bromodomain-containing protein, partial [Ramicandelaber brevisporus]
FRSLPSAEDYPDYYQIIKKPIALDTISGKANASEYESLNAFLADVELMCRNAQLYNAEESQVF